MLIELHILQNFAPSNLNRDDTNSPKDCEFGGYRRARVSSQCWKRAIRTVFKEQQLLPEQHLAARTKRVTDALVERMQLHGLTEQETRPVIEAMLAGVKLPVKEGKTQYLLFLGRVEIQRIADLCWQHWDALQAIAAPAAAAGASQSPSTSRTSARDAKKAGKDAIPPEITKSLEAALDGGKAADLALFGRMLADLPQRNIDAACQVAHAISTNKVSVEFDFYTAVDDLKPEDTAGADMLGTVEFNSSCFYRYANMDLRQLVANLDGDVHLARETLAAFLRASILAIPAGKQNSMAAQNPPSLVLAVVRDRGLWSLANAFVKPVWPGPNGDLIQQSVAALDAYWGKLAKMYGVAGIRGKWALTMEDGALSVLAGDKVDGLDQLIDAVMGAVRGEASAAA